MSFVSYLLVKLPNWKTALISPNQMQPSNYHDVVVMEIPTLEW